MERRYQVFVSSTYEDLEEERREVMQALLSMGCFPAGMELFPAADDDQWTLIKREIDQSDYYLVISAGKYGSLHPTEGKSFTQMEYEYAVAKGKPTIAFLYKDLGKLAADKTERDDEPRRKLEAFREATKTRHCKMWDSRDSLAKAVYQAVHYLMQEKPSSGWVRAATVYDEREMLTLKNRNLQLENELQPLRLAGLVNAGTSPTPLTGVRCSPVQENWIFCSPTVGHGGIAGLLSSQLLLASRTTDCGLCCPTPKMNGWWLSYPGDSVALLPNCRIGSGKPPDIFSRSRICLTARRRSRSGFTPSLRHIRCTDSMTVQ